MSGGHDSHGGHGEKSGGGMLATIGGFFAGAIGGAMHSVCSSADGILRGLLPGEDGGGGGHHDHGHH